MPRIGVFAVFLFKYLFLIYLLSIGNAQAAIYYVEQKNPAASDANPGTEVAPWLSLDPTSRIKLLPGDMVLVKEGIYIAGVSSEVPTGQINPHESGKPGKPIIFKSSPQFAATITGDGRVLAPVQVIGQSHITIEGFRIVNPGENGILVKGDKNNPVEGVAIRNNIIIQEQATEGVNLVNGINIEYATGTIIDNNRISSTDKNNRPLNSTAIKAGNVANQLIEYNEMENMANGISLRRNVSNTKVGKNIASNTLQSIHVSSEQHSIITGLRIANNVFTDSGIGVSMVPNGGIIRKTDVNNNVFHNYTVAAMQIVQPGMGKINIWNNIFKRQEQDKIFIADILTYDDPPLSIARMDYNIFAVQPLFITGLYSSNRRLSTLNTWQEFAEQDKHSTIAAIEFTNAVNKDFRIAKKYRNIRKGTVDGSPRSRRVEIGAYTSAIEKIGMTMPSTVSKTETMRSKENKPTKSITTSVDTRPVSAGTQEQGGRQSEQASVVVGSVQKKLMSTIKSRSLEWEVDHRIQFGGKCVLESNKIDFFDGYDNTGLTFRVLDDQLYLLTKSNIDMSFHDVGLQVGNNAFLHADSVVSDQNVVIAREMPKLLTQLRKTSETRVQLRFWPSYPATQAYSEVVTLDGFIPAYESYKDCQRGN